MGDATTLVGWLADLDEAALARVLTNRRDVLLAPHPRTLGELADRLGRGESLAAILRALPVPCVQLAEAFAALGGSSTPDELGAFLEGGMLDSAWLQVLAEHGILWTTKAGKLVGPPALIELFASPLGLGPPLRKVLESVPVEGMLNMLRALGRTMLPTRRADALELLVTVLAHPDTVREIASTAPSEVQQELARWAAQGAVGLSETEEYYYDPSAHQRRSTAGKWAEQRGLMISQGWSFGWQMPAEVSRALRGADYRAPFAAEPPPVEVSVTDAERLDSHAAAMVSTFAELVLAVVDRLARTPVPALKSGGVGTRELAKLGKAVGCNEADTRLILELCAALGLIARSAVGWALSDTAEQWRAQSPADRTGQLLEGWWELTHSPTESRDLDDKVVPALTARPCEGCLIARHNLMQVAAELPAGGSAERLQLAVRAIWRRPFVHLLPQDLDVPFDTIFAEATTLGVLANGASATLGLTRIGRAVVAGDDAALGDLLRAALPASNDRALFGADLTVVVTGAPTASLSGLLDASADRESRGGATVWRFSPGSIRRALDEGRTADTLENELAAVATTELPQALRYLLGDIGRQHGNLRVSAAVSVVRSNDEALLKQVEADRALRKLGLRLLAPTVLGADAESEVVLTSLRKAGYLPMPEGDVPITAAVERAPSQLAAYAEWLPTLGPHPAPADPDQLAARLRAPRPARIRPDVPPD